MKYSVCCCEEAKRCSARNLAAGGRWAAAVGLHAAKGALTVHSPARMTRASRQGAPGAPPLEPKRSTYL